MDGFAPESNIFLDLLLSIKIKVVWINKQDGLADKSVFIFLLLNSKKVD